MGGFNSFFWIDRERDVTAALYTQTLPFYDARVLALVERFERAAYAELAANPTS
jgi:CubicO group peptidase (beta-lactamase class C family)